MKIEIIKPIAYCSGVKIAIDKAIDIKKQNPNKSVYIFGSLVHNSHVIDILNDAGIINLDDPKTTLIEKISSIEQGNIAIFSAHGHDEAADEYAKERGVITYDCVCPKVKASMDQIKEKVDEGYNVIYVGIHNHQEAKACLSISPQNIHFYDAKMHYFDKFYVKKPVFVTNQTTLNYNELEVIFQKIKKIYPDAIFNNEICPATRLRQENIKNLPDDVDCIFIVGDKNSSNTKRLFEVAKEFNKKASTYLVSSRSDIIPEMLVGKNHVAIASGTSAPLEIINSVYEEVEKLSK